MKQSIFSYTQTLISQLKSVYSTKQEQQQVAWLLLEKVTNVSQSTLIAQKEFFLTEIQEEQLDTYLHELVMLHKPLQYILGSIPFLDLEIFVEPPILIPRPETEEWVAHLIAVLRKLPHKVITILDLCTGSGVIALALAKALPEATIYAIDIEQHSLALAQQNAHYNDIKNVIFLQSDLFSHIPKGVSFDLIVTNPPYISEQEFSSLAAMVSEWEDKKALVAQENGLEIIQKIIEQAPQCLQYNQEFVDHHIGQLYCEIGYQQGNKVKKIMQQAGYLMIIIQKDYAGHDRVAIAQKRKT